MNCFGQSTGSATASATGGTTPYTYSWNTSPVQTTATATGLAAGTYTVTVTDNKGCTSTSNVTITQPSAALSASVPTQTNVNCFGQSTGSATASATGGTAPYTYSWNTSPVQSTITATGLSAGTYTVTVTDNKGCTSTSNVTITQPAASLSSVCSNTNPTSYGANDGYVTVVASGGTAPYTYSWNTSPIQTTATVSGLSSGTYIVTITDSKGCITSCTTTFALTDLRIIKTTSNTNPTPGSTITFTLTATNLGPNNATNVVVTDSIKSGYNIISATPSTGTWVAPNWTIGNFSNGASATLTIVATVNFSGDFSNVATIKGSETDPNLSNNTSTITPASIRPITENGTVPSTGGTAINNVLSNDYTNGHPSTTTNSTISQVGLWPSGITLNPSTGSVTVVPGTTPGNYPIVYQLCDKLSPVNCATVTDTVKVTPLIKPVTESGIVSSATGGIAINNVLSNDSTNGYPSTLINSTISQVGLWPSGITLNTSTGSVTVVPGTTPGTYPITYQLCDKLSPVSCATMLDTVRVTPSIVPVTENGTVPSTGGTAINNVLSNDYTNGHPSTTTNSTISQVGLWPSGITLNPSTGSVTVVPGTTPGNYPIVYQLCDKLSPVNCATVTDTVKVTPLIKPVTESGIVSSATGGIAINNVLSNDSTNGYPSTLINSTISQVGLWPSGITLNTSTGSVTVVPGTTPGTYPITYQLCDKLSPVSCATMLDTVRVTPSIVPVTENGTVPSTGGTAIP